MSKKKKDDEGTAEGVAETADVISYRTIGLFDACTRKRRIGIEEHGNEYSGDPVEDSLAEICDALNYMDFAERQGMDIDLTEAVRARLVEVASMLRELPPIRHVTIRTDW